MVQQVTSTRRRFLQLSGIGVAGMTLTRNVQANGIQPVFVHPQNRQSEAATAVRNNNGRARHIYENFDFISAVVPRHSRGNLEQAPGISFVEDDSVVHPHHHRDDHTRGGPNKKKKEKDQCDHPAEDPSWGHDRIFGDSDASKDDTYDSATGAGVDIAIVDSGLQSDHCDLKDNIAGGVNFTDAVSDWEDDTGHGTHCAGVAAAVDNDIGVVGVAPDANLWAVKVLHDGSGYLSDIAAGIDWCIENEREVISMSFGGDSESESISTAIETAYQEGHLLVSSAGNYDNDGDGDCSENNVGFPAFHEDVIAVTAMDSDDTITSYSSVGSAAELLAPGDDISSTTTGDGYETKSGTSVAAPHVSGTIALAWERLGANGPNPEDRDRIREVLRSETEDVLGTCEEGYGLVRPDFAVSNFT